MHERVFRVSAAWDDEAKVWYVRDSDIPGLATEAPTADKLVQHICELAPDLIHMNEADGDHVPIELMWSGTQRVSLEGC